MYVYNFIMYDKECLFHFLLSLCWYISYPKCGSRL